MSVAGIILAAGEGSRMGGAVKQMLPFKGKPILELVIDNAVVSSLDRVVLVIGHRADLIEPMLSGRDVAVVVNRDYKNGQSSSIKAGLEAVTEETDAVLFLLGDQPLVSPETINILLNAYRNSAAPIVLPVFKGKRGNPVLFSRETFSRIKQLKGDCGARSLFEEYAGRVLEVQVTDNSIHFDVDTDEDYQRLLESEIVTPVR